MPRNLLKKIVNDEDILHTALNAFLTWGAGTSANLVSNSLGRFDLGKYNLKSHAIVGVVEGTLACRKIDNGLKGLGLALGIATLLNVGWELWENLYVFKDPAGLTSIDTISDVAMIYSGVLLSFLGEKAKEYINEEKPTKEMKWVL